MFYAVHFFALFAHAYCIDVTHCRLLKTAWGDSVFTSQLIFSSNDGQTTQTVDLEVGLLISVLRHVVSGMALPSPL